MSLIETALRKIKSSEQQARSQASEVAPAPRGGRQDPRPEIDPTKVRQYRPASLDAAAMELNCIFPQVSDVLALRAYKILRTRLMQRLAANQWTSIGVTSTESGQGKTLTAVNLAIALAQDPSTYVFLVDLDLQRPRVAAVLGMQFERGLGEYLMGEAEIDDITYNPGIDRLAIVPNTRAFEHGSEFLAAPRMAKLHQALSAEIPRRIVIYDMPPLLLSDEVLTFAPQIDGLLLVVSEGQTARGSVERAKELLADMNLIGVVLNRSTERNDSSYY
jgi:protein-tyrosine kinase